MINLSEDSLICDFAQYYNIYDYKSLPLKTVGVLAVGLPEDSRIMLKMSNQKVDTNKMLLGVIADRLGLLLWQNAGGDESNRPESITQQLMGIVKEKKDMGFDSVEDFEAFRASIIGRS